MTVADLVPLLPLLILGVAPVVIMLVLAFHRDHQVTLALTLLALTASFFSLPIASAEAPRRVTELLIVDRYALFYMGLLIAASCAVVLLSYSYLEQRAGQHEEFYLLILLATLGSATLVASRHFAAFFLGLEVLSVSLYALMAYPRTWAHGIEAGIKYLILAAGSAAFLLFGIALVYAELGSLEFGTIARLQVAGHGANPLVLLTGVGLLVVGIGFKLAVVPFHQWTPDVYEGAPAPVAGFVATSSKGAMFALLLRLFGQMDLAARGPVFQVFLAIAIASMLIGNLLALLQNNVKRILAYSSIAHLGYLLVALLAGGVFAVVAATFYLVAYFITTLTVFGILTLLSTGERDADRLEDYRGLFWRHPWLAAAFSASLLSLAGIPLTVGFVGKFYLVAAGVGHALWPALFVLVATSVIGLFYYLRIIVAMSLQPAEKSKAPTLAPSMSLSGSLVLAVLVLLLVCLGVYPSPFIHMIQEAASLVQGA